MSMEKYPYIHVDSSLRGLAGEAEGFGRDSIGGAHGDVYRVTTLADDGPGSLRYGCRKKEPLWIVFDVSGTVQLSSYLNVSSYKTIDGRGQRIKLTGKGLRLKECEHVIICNLEFEGGRGHDVDAIQIKPKSRHIWIDRCSLCDYDDSLIDITRESTDITISRCHFSNHDKTMLIGADPSHVTDRCIRVTIHHCFFDGTRQRHPRVRFGKVHLYNNYIRNWDIYAVCASVEAQIYSQCNIYEAGQKKLAIKYLTEKAADKEDAGTGCIRSDGDLFKSGTKAGLLCEEGNEEAIFHPNEFYSTWTVEPPTDDLKHMLQHRTGWQSVPCPIDLKAKESLLYTHVDSTLRALAGQAEGFGRGSIGGLHGALYHVTTLADDGPGSLRDGCRKKEPLWIVFEVSGVMHLSSYLSVSSYKTIDGRGQRIKLTGKGLRLKECEHVIICNLEFEGGRGHDVDAIQIKPKSKHIWIDRCSLCDYDDSLIDITRESTDITISRCHFSNHDKTMLIGADPSHVTDRDIRVTIHHCFFDGTRQRHPRVRFGKVHLYNNYTRNWGIYAVCASVEAQIYSQCNIYEAGQKKLAMKYLTEKAADKEKEGTGCITSDGDLFKTGTKSGLLCQERNEQAVFHPSEFYPTWTVEPPTNDLKLTLLHRTGWQSVLRPLDTNV